MSHQSGGNPIRHDTHAGFSTTKDTGRFRALAAHLARCSRSTQRLHELIEEATVDAHDESEQRMGFLTMLQDSLALPFTTEILGVPVAVERIDIDDAEEIVALCRRGTHRQLISIRHLPLPSPRPVGSEWIAAYRRWARRELCVPDTSSMKP